MAIAGLELLWLWCPRLSRSSVLRWGFALSLALAAPHALAEPKDDAARSLQKEAMDGDYLGTQFKDAEQKLQKALKTCGKKGCSKSLLAELHRDLAVVYIAGLKKKDKGKKEMQAAVKVDPELQLSPDFTTPDVQKAYEAAGGVPAKPEPEPEPDDEVTLEEEAPTAPPPEEAPDAGGAKNWFSLSFQQDMLLYGETTEVCSGGNQYHCFLQGESYTGDIYDGAGNQLQSGLGFATRRILVGYDRRFGENITLGARLGFAFNGSPKATTPDATAFLPLHAELRVSYWLGDKPLASDGLRPYLGLAAGIAEVDGHVPVEYFIDAQGATNGNKGTLDAWRKTGNTMLALHAGAAYAIKPQHALHLELRLLQMLGSTATGLAFNLGYTLGL
jgi:hypothetical protein